MLLSEDIDNMIPVILFGLRLEETEEEFEHALKEMVSLCGACNLEVRDMITQMLPHPDPATYIGTGKAEELAYAASASRAEYAVCLENLSPAQMKNLQKATGISIWDRTNLILEIFSRRARSREARIQVELAYLQYMLPRLSGMWQHLGRQSGGGGSRANKGIGEKQIELDRRQIAHRITELKKELARIEKTRDVQRKGRLREKLPHAALVGYTNAGKSSLMNHLLEMGDRSSAADDKKVFEKDMLFATLDTSIRRIDIPGRKPFLLSDTVGFIENIPHDLIQAFRSTLAEVKYADVLLIVLDSADPHHEMHKKVTEDTLKDLGALDIPRIYVYNKADLRPPELTVENHKGNETVYISARTGYGTDDMLELLYETFSAGCRRVDVIIPYSSGEIVDLLHREADIVSESYEEDGIHIVADCPGKIADRIEKQ